MFNVRSFVHSLYSTVAWIFVYIVIATWRLVTGQINRQIRITLWFRPHTFIWPLTMNISLICNTSAAFALWKLSNFQFSLNHHDQTYWFGIYRFFSLDLKENLILWEKNLLNHCLLEGGAISKQQRTNLNQKNRRCRYRY